MFWTKKIKEKNKRYILEFIKNALIKNIKIYNILDVIEISNSVALFF
jgi:RecG-like helicase